MLIKMYKFSAHDVFMEKPSSGKLQSKAK